MGVDLQIVRTSPLEFSPGQAATQREYPREWAHNRSVYVSYFLITDEMERLAWLLLSEWHGRVAWSELPGTLSLTGGKSGSSQ